MKAVVQRVVNANVTVQNNITGKIDCGLLVYLGVTHDDTKEDADRLADKISFLRIFDDADGKMNLSLKDIIAEKKEAGMLVVSQFTLLADTRRGRRPSWNNAALPEKANQLYEYFIKKIREYDINCQSGVFQACMMVTYTNDGPVTIILDSKI